jgi:hypothetical protein
MLDLAKHIVNQKSARFEPVTLLGFIASTASLRRLNAA